MRTPKDIKKNSIIRMILLLLILIIVNILSSFVFTRIDMTEEKRYSLSPASRTLAGKLDDIVYFKVYLEGELPPGFNRLKTSIREMLDEFRVYAGENINYEFIDPSEGKNEKEVVDLYKQLSEKGLYPTNLEQKKQSGKSQKIIFPGAIVNYRSREFPLQFLKTSGGASPEQMLNTSVESLEFEIANILRRITQNEAKHIGMLKGHGEYSALKTYDAVNSLSEFYFVDTMIINGQLNALKDYEAIIIAGPDSAFDEKDKFIIDQFIMNGGKVLWLLDRMQINMDSLTRSSTNVALPLDLNLDDMLFRYGVRINSDLLMDLQAAPIPVVTGYIGDQPRQEIFPWFYFPLLNTESKHPIVHNLNSVKSEFVSSIDTIENDIKKTILLTTGKYSKLQMAPARVSLNMLRDKPDPAFFNRHHIPAAVLLEGNFTSNYLNRIPDKLASAPEIGFKDKSPYTAMIVTSDADIIANHVTKKGNIYPLGFDRYNQQTYGNKNFILNCVDYLCGNKDIINLRGKEIKLRLIDPAKTNNASLPWMNVVIPVLGVVIFGMTYTYFKKKKFADEKK